MTKDDQDADFHIPSEPEGFKNLLKGVSLKNTIHELHTSELDSGSDVTNEQFALLRAYYPPYVKRTAFGKYCKKELDLMKARASARELLDASLSYGNMLRVVGNPLTDIDSYRRASIIQTPLSASSNSFVVYPLLKRIKKPWRTPRNPDLMLGGKLSHHLRSASRPNQGEDVRLEL